MGLFNLLKKASSNKSNQIEFSVNEFPNSEYLDDVTYIRELKHLVFEPWHQYDVLLAARGYGWNTMKNWADYMSEADLENISEVIVGSLGGAEENITKSYIENKCKSDNTPELDIEMGVLSIAGISKTLHSPVKIVWFNQTQILRFFTTVETDQIIEKYIETTIRQTFGTTDAMKRGKPIPPK